MRNLLVQPADHRSGAELARLEPGVAADAHPLMRGLHRFHDAGDGPFADGALYGQAGHGHAARKAVTQPLEHRLQDRRNTGEHVDILQNEPRRGAQRIVDQGRILGNVGHFLARGIEVEPGILVMRQQPRLCLGMPDHLPAEGGSDAFGRDVIMGRPDAAAGEHQIIGGGHGFHRIYDGLADIGNDPRLAKLNSLAVQLFGKPADILVLGAPAENFITDHDDGGGRVGHGSSPCCQITVRVQPEITSIRQWSRLQRCENMPVG